VPLLNAAPKMRLVVYCDALWISVDATLSHTDNRSTCSSSSRRRERGDEEKKWEKIAVGKMLLE
jgi:hypothetical protein